MDECDSGGKRLTSVGCFSVPASTAIYALVAIHAAPNWLDHCPAERRSRLLRLGRLANVEGTSTARQCRFGPEFRRFCQSRANPARITGVAAESSRDLAGAGSDG